MRSNYQNGTFSFLSRHQVIYRLSRMEHDGTAALPSFGVAQKSDGGTAYRFFLAAEAAFVEAAVERLIPSKPEWPAPLACRTISISSWPGRTALATACSHGPRTMSEGRAPNRHVEAQSPEMDYDIDINRQGQLAPVPLEREADADCYAATARASDV